MKTRSLVDTMLVAAWLSTLVFAPLASADVKLIGSGASFPFPIYSKWFKDFSAANKGVRVDYQSKGSGAGIQDFINQVVDFAGSDAAMNDEEISKVKNGVVLLPVTAGEIVLTYNLKGVEELKLPRAVYPEIFTGKVTKWNDPKIAAANPGVQLPDQDITVVVRSDSSGTTYVFTGHLSAINEAFKSSVGQGKSPQWPKSRNLVKAPKNDGVTATVKQTPGAVGYIEYGYAKLTKAPVAMLENKDGKFVGPGPETGSAALASAQFPKGNLPGSDVPDLRAWVYEPSGENAYPIATFTWLLFPQMQDPEKAKVARQLVEYCLTEGQKSADALGYVPLPEEVVETVRKVAQKIQ
jgi:phosphate transport system substrate-binding protein